MLKVVWATIAIALAAFAAACSSNGVPVASAGTFVPTMTAPFDGTYVGQLRAGDNNRASCEKPSATVTVTSGRVSFLVWEANVQPGGHVNLVTNVVPGFARTVTLDGDFAGGQANLHSHTNTCDWFYTGKRVGGPTVVGAQD